MSESEKTGPDTPNNEGAAKSGEKSGAISWTVAVIVLVLALLMWDYSEILFASRHRAEAVALLKPDMRLTTAERELNKACYSTLYVSPAGLPPMLEVTTCRRPPWTLQALRRAVPGWDLPEQTLGRLLARTQFTVYGNTSGTVAKVENGLPLVLVEGF
jgi:hypothetical protein